MKPSSKQDFEDETLIRESKTLKLSCKRQESRGMPCYHSWQALGKRFALNSKTMVIGRGCECEISILDGSLSRAHAQVSKKDNRRVYVSDLDSTNGTYLNDRS